MSPKTTPSAPTTSAELVTARLAPASTWQAYAVGARLDEAGAETIVQGLSSRGGQSPRQSRPSDRPVRMFDHAGPATAAVMRNSLWPLRAEEERGMKIDDDERRAESSAASRAREPGADEPDLKMEAR